MMLELFITSTVLILGVFALRKLTMGKISMRLRYALWLLVAVRLLVPVSVGASAFSVMNLMPETARENTQMLSVGRGTDRQQTADDGRDLALADETGRAAIGERTADGETAVGQMKEEKGPTPASVLGEKVSVKRTAPDVLGTLWLLGFLAVGGYMAVSKWRFLAYLHRNRKVFPKEAVPEQFAKRFSCRRIKVYQVKGLPSPCLAGRHIYIGEGTDTAERNLTHILAHEYCHAVHGDGLWALLRCALAAVYWFDPFVWAAAYAARQDSELACDEAAVKLLGEASRFAYGRTLLALLESAGGREKCPGMTFMTEGGERNIRERITALTEKSRTKGPVLAAVLAAVVLVCGCAFTSAEQEGVHPVQGTGELEASGTGGKGQDENDTAENVELIEGQLKELEESVAISEEQIKKLEESALREAERAAFEETLRCYAETDDAELLQKRQFDVQSYSSWKEGEGGKKPEDGWYLLCREDGGLVYLYGLYTENFGFRGIKVRIGGDVTNLDLPWCASYLNGSGENIRIMESAENGWPRRFVWKLLAEESGTTEIWRLYSGYRHDSGTIDLKTLTGEDCVGWAKEYLAFDVDKEAAKVHVTYDGDMYLGAMDISAYQDWETEDVQIVPDTVGFVLDDPGEETLHYQGDEGDYQMYSDAAYEGTAVHLVAGLKFSGVEGLWFDGLPLLTIQVVEDEESTSGFRLEYPRIDKTYAASAPLQERELAERKDGNASAQAGNPAGAGREDLEKPTQPPAPASISG